MNVDTTYYQRLRAEADGQQPVSTCPDGLAKCKLRLVDDGVVTIANNRGGGFFRIGLCFCAIRQ